MARLSEMDAPSAFVEHVRLVEKMPLTAYSHIYSACYRGAVTSCA